MNQELEPLVLEEGNATGCFLGQTPASEFSPFPFANELNDLRPCGGRSNSRMHDINSYQNPTP